MQRTRESSCRKRCIVALMAVTLLPGMSLAIDAGGAVDVVPFGEIKRWDSGGKDYGVFWEDSRDIFKVVVRFADSAPAVRPSRIALQYWQSTWPRQRIPRDQPSGAGSSGWLNVGDWYQGKWLKADANLQVAGPVYTFTFNPVSAAEFPESGTGTRSLDPDSCRRRGNRARSARASTGCDTTG